DPADVPPRLPRRLVGLALVGRSGVLSQPHMTVLPHGEDMRGGGEFGRRPTADHYAAAGEDLDIRSVAGGSLRASPVANLDGRQLSSICRETARYEVDDCECTGTAFSVDDQAAVQLLVERYSLTHSPSL